MSLSVTRLDSSNAAYRMNTNLQRRTTSAGTVPMTSNNTTPVQKKEQNSDEKFSFFRAAKNFAKGLVSPITGMFESKKAFAMGALTIAGSTGLVAAFGMPAAIAMIGIGVGLGTLQGAKAIYKFASAKNNKEREDSFYDAGGACGTIGLSTLGAKGTLRLSGIKTKGMSSFKATLECLKDFKNSAKECFEIFKSGHYKSNFKNAISNLFVPKKFKKIADEMCNEGKRNYRDGYNELKELFPEEYQQYLSGRPKSKSSLLNKIKNECNFDRQIAKIKRDTKLSEEQKIKKINDQLGRKKRFEQDPLKYVREEVADDIIGVRLEKNCDMNKIVNQITKNLDKNKTNITEIRNYRGANNEEGFYFTKEQVEQIQEGASKNGLEIDVLQGKKQIKPSGYCAVQMKVQLKNGTFAEIQVRGEDVGKFAAEEHTVFDIESGKDITHGNRFLRSRIAPLETAIKKLTAEQKKLYQQYKTSEYDYRRYKELGYVVEPPQLPEGLDPILAEQSLGKIHNETKDIRIIDKKFTNIIPQTAISYGILTKNRKKSEN